MVSDAEKLVLSPKGHSTGDDEYIQGNQLVESVVKWAAINSLELHFVTSSTLTCFVSNLTCICCGTEEHPVTEITSLLHTHIQNI